MKKEANALFKKNALENYKNQQKEYKKIVENSKTSTDPILQRDENKYSSYVKKPAHEETTNYYNKYYQNRDIQKPKETYISKPQPKKQYLLTDEVDPSYKEIPKKKPIATDYEKNIHENNRISSIKYVNSKAKNDNIDKLFSGQTPYVKEINHIKVPENSGKSSEELRRENDRKKFLPSFNNDNNHNFHNLNNNNISTKNRVFGTDNNDNNYKEVAHKKGIRGQESTVQNIYRYDNAPKNYDIAVKPNNVEFNELDKYREVKRHIKKK